MSWLFSSWLTWAAIVAALAIGGGLLLVAGLYPRRRGETPYCRGCGYNLTGTALEAADALCPECGGPVASPRGIVRGERVRRYRRVAAGTACLLVAVASVTAFAVATAQKFDWYTIRPTTWVLEELRKGDSKGMRKAFSELVRRERAGLFSPSQAAAFVDALLDDQTRMSRSAIVLESAEWLADAYFTRRLSEAQRERFLRQMGLANVRVRRRAILGQALPNSFLIEYRGPPVQSMGLPRGFEVEYDWESVTLDDKSCLEEVRGQSRGMFPTGAVGGSAKVHYSGVTHHGSAFKAHHQGQHAIRARVAFRVFEAPSVGAPPAERTLVGEFAQELRAEFEVLASKPADYVRLRSSPDLDSAVAKHVRLDVVAVPARPSRPQLSLVVGREVPIGVAFELVEPRNLYYSSSQGMTGRSGEEAWNPVDAHGFRPGDVVPKTVDLVFRASVPAAERTTDLFEIWDGELVFEGVHLDAPGRTVVYPKTRRIAKGQP